MTKTITANYDSSGKIRNAREDLIASGIDQEKIYVSDESRQLKVLVPGAVEPEITEILRRHDPDKVEAHET